MASLSTEPGSSRPKQRQRLHQLKRRLGWSDDDLHNAIGVASTKLLSAAGSNLRKLLGLIRRGVGRFVLALYHAAMRLMVALIRWLETLIATSQSNQLICSTAT